MKIIIKNRYTDKTIIEGEAVSVTKFLEANREADLYEADLRGAKIKITQKDEILESIGVEFSK